MRWQLDKTSSSSSTTSPPTSGSATSGSGATGSGGSAAFAAAHQVHPVSGKPWGAGKRGLIRVWVRRRPAGISRRVGRNRFDRFGTGSPVRVRFDRTARAAPPGRPSRPIPGGLQACPSLLPTGGFGGGGGLNSATTAAYRNCLTLHGVTIPTTPPPTTAGTLRATRGASVASAASQQPDVPGRPEGLRQPAARPDRGGVPAPRCRLGHERRRFWIVNGTLAVVVAALALLGANTIFHKSSAHAAGAR